MVFIYPLTHKTTYFIQFLPPPKLKFEISAINKKIQAHLLLLGIFCIK